MKNTVLFSDIHLKPGDASAARRSFIAFLRSINPAETERLICLGDLFDFWYEYRHAMFHGYFDVLRAFADLRDAGVALHLICGNHDFWAGPVLEALSGITPHHGATHMGFGERRALLLHGDGLNPKDYGYRVFKRMARNPVLTRLFRRVHPDAAMTLALCMSRNSRALTGAEQPDAAPEARHVRAHALQLLRDGAADIVICGHAHVPAVEQVASGIYINPGDWPRCRSYVVFDGQDFALRTFSE